MLWAIFAMLLIMGAVGFLASYTLVGAVIQILLISALVVLWINRIWTVSTQIRRYQVD